MPDATAAISDELDGLGISTDLTDAVLQAVDNAGYDLTPKAGGSPVEALASLTAVRSKLAGVPGRYIVETTLSDGTTKVAWLEMEIDGKVMPFPLHTY